MTNLPPKSAGVSPSDAEQTDPTVPNSEANVPTNSLPPYVPPWEEPANADPENATLPVGPVAGEHLVSTPPNPKGPFPQRFGRYEILRRLGGGGMGDVYEACDTLVGDVRVALKIPKPHLQREARLRNQFLAEARAGLVLHHPNICRVLHVDALNGTVYLVMDLVRGVSLAAYRPGGQRTWPWDQAVELVRQLALALAAAHDRMVLHRDIKPSNVLLRGDQDPVLTDFGLALHLSRRDADMPIPGAIVGTLPYLAPEQLRWTESEPPGFGCDIYGLGALLYELLTGQPPFVGANESELLAQILKRTPALPSELVPGIPGAVDAICLKTLAKHPEGRFIRATALAAALGEARSLGSAGHRAEPPGPGQAQVVPRDKIHFDFVCPGGPVPAVIGNRVYLDVGNDLRAGVIDHHCATAASASTTHLVLDEPKLIDAVVQRFQANDRFHLVMHDNPDLDCVAAAYLVSEYLTTGRFPAGAPCLAHYVDGADRGESWLALEQPFTLYTAYVSLVNRRHHDADVHEKDRWRADVAAGVELARFTLHESVQLGVPLDQVDAFACPHIVPALDRQIMVDDIQRYRHKMSLAATQPRVAQLRLPGLCGGTVRVSTLFVRGVQDRSDPERVAFFKDWARSDRERSPENGGFVGLSVYMSGASNKTRRCILSLRPDSRATLRGLAARLEAAESRARIAKEGIDDRVIDPQTRLPVPPRPGYDNSDPWYDGRGHRYTIVDAPNQGTVLTADEIDQVFLEFGEATVKDLKPLV
jgi:hypothetical protein